ncbi:MAG: ATP-dependent DNA helicase PcrA, partial [Calditrichaeota bacterium]
MQDLNDAQREAVQCVEGPLLVLAGAGSGKTRVLTYRIAYLIEQRLAYPNQILAVTFTNKAANEMKRRVEALLGTAVEGMWIGTFHSICARILRIEAEHLGYDSNFTIYDVDDQIRLIQQVMEGLNISQEIIKPRQVHYTISDCKNKMLGPAEYEKRASTVPEQRIARIYHEYEKAKRRSNAFDFDDLLLMPLELFTRDKAILEKYQKKFRYILVDEYQDTNKAQYHLIRLLGAQHRNICVVGDEDQSIYRWRGADIENILTFEKDYPECTVIRLEQNYRSTQVILDAANAVVANNQRRLGKNLWSRKKGGKKISRRVTLNEEHEAAEVVKIILQEMQEHPYNYNDFAVLYRTNAQSRALEERLRRANIPYTIVGGIKFYERKEIKDILAYLRLIANPRDSVALRRIINFPTRGIGTVTLGRLEAFALKHQIGVYEAARRVDEVKELSINARKRIREFVETIDALREKAREV